MGNIVITDDRQGRNQRVQLVFGTYLTPDGNPALSAVTDDELQEPWATYSTNPGGKLLPGKIAIKDWSEGEGVPELLIREGIIEPVEAGMVRSGYVIISIFTLTEKGLAAFNSRRIK